MNTSTATSRKLVLRMSVSLDGFVAGPNGELDWAFRSMGDPKAREWILKTLGEADAHLMGSGAYYDMAAFWPYSDSPLASAMNDIPKIIFSRSGIKDGTQRNRTEELDDADAARIGQRSGVTPTAAVLRSWAEPTVASGDLVKEVLRLKEQPGKGILAHGGARFAQSLVASGLIDEYRLAVHPVVLGQGQSLFCALRNTTDLRLISATTYATGVVGLVYQPQ